MTTFMSKASKTKKSRTGIFKDFTVGLFILACSFLPYIHDFDAFKGAKGFSGFSSLRVALWAISLFVVALSGWIVAFMNSRGRSYRFVMLSPIFMLTYQLAIYLFDARNTSSNEFEIKIILNLAFMLLLMVVYYFGKLKKDDK